MSEDIELTLYTDSTSYTTEKIMIDSQEYDRLVKTWTAKKTGAATRINGKNKVYLFFPHTSSVRRAIFSLPVPKREDIAPTVTVVPAVTPHAGLVIPEKLTGKSSDFVKQTQTKPVEETKSTQDPYSAHAANCICNTCHELAKTTAKFKGLDSLTAKYAAVCLAATTVVDQHFANAAVVNRAETLVDTCKAEAAMKLLEATKDRLDEWDDEAGLFEYGVVRVRALMETAQLAEASGILTGLFTAYPESATELNKYKEMLTEAYNIMYQD